MNKTETTRLLSVLKAQYQHKFHIDAMTAGVWMELLNQPPMIPYQAAHQAALTWMRDNEWPPQVKDLRDIIAETHLGIPNADAAWNQLQTWLKGSYPGIPNNQPPLPSLIVEAVREIGGTSMIRNEGDKMREKFGKAYDRRRREQMRSDESATALTALDGGTVRALPGKDVA